METENNKLAATLAVAFIAGIVGAVIWAVIIILFRYEVAILAWGLGGLSGYAIGLVAKQQVKPIHQLIAVVSAMLGIIAGKYAAFAYAINGKTVAGIFDPDMITVFQKNLSISFGGIDIIFIILAVITAWQVPLQFKHADEDKDEIHQHIDVQDEDVNHAENNQTENHR